MNILRSTLVFLVFIASGQIINPGGGGAVIAPFVGANSFTSSNQTATSTVDFCSSGCGSSAVGMRLLSWGANSSTPGDATVLGISSAGTGLVNYIVCTHGAGVCTFTGPVVATSVGPSTTTLWTSGSGTPSGSCSNGSLYTSTTGTTTNILWACGSSAWQLVK